MFDRSRWSAGPGRAVALLAAVALAGCIDHTVLLKVKPDGSGELVETTLMRGEMVEMMKAMAASEDAASPEEEAAGKRAKAEARAASLGPGVSFVSWEEVSSEETIGETAIYRFDDVSKLAIVPSPPSDEGETETDAEDGEEPLRFQFERQGKRSVLTALFPPDAEEAEAAPAVEVSEAEAAAAEAAASMQAGMMEMMKGFLEGFRMRVLVEVEGEVEETDAPHVEGSQVTLMAFDFDQIMADEDAWKKLTALGDQPSMAEVSSQLRGVPGVHVPAGKEVRIEFSGD